MSSATKPTSGEPVSQLKEARYSLKEMLHEVEHERRNSVLGMELVDQSEIGTIFKTRAKRKPAKT